MFRPGLRGLVKDVAHSCRGHDLALYAGGVTFYAAIGVVPLLLIAVYLAGRIVGPPTVLDLSTGLARQLPDSLGAPQAARALGVAGDRLGLGAAVAAFVPASLYGEGMVRAFDRLSMHGERGRRTLRGRLGSLGIVAASPVLLLIGLATTHALTSTLGTGFWSRALGTYLAFLVGWLSISVMLAFAYGAMAPERPGRRALAWGALGTGSMLSGTSLGFLVFLRLDLPLAQAYGGAVPVAAAAAALLWLYLLHAIFLVGYITTLRLAARRGHPLGRVVDRDTVRPAAVDPTPAIATSSGASRE